MTPATRRFFFSLHVQLQQRRLTGHLGETTPKVLDYLFHD